MDPAEAETGAPLGARATAPLVVGYDGSPGGRDALELARVLCAVEHQRAFVGTCMTIAPGSARGPLPDEPDADSQPLFEQARSALYGVEVETHVLGSRAPGRRLLEAAEQEGAAAIVVGAPHLTVLGHSVLGSVAEHVLHGAHCEIAIAPEHYGRVRHEGLGRIGVAFDGTEDATAALRRAEVFALASGASIEILVADSLATRGMADSDERERGYAIDVPNLLERAIETVDPGLRPTGRLLDSGWREADRSIAAAIAAAAASGVDLLVAGSHHRGNAGRILFGSVTSNLIELAKCPVLVVPRAA